MCPFQDRAHETGLAQGMCPALAPSRMNVLPGKGHHAPEPGLPIYRCRRGCTGMRVFARVAADEQQLAVHSLYAFCFHNNAAFPWPPPPAGVLCATSMKRMTYASHHVMHVSAGAHAVKIVCMTHRIRIQMHVHNHLCICCLQCWAYRLFHSVLICASTALVPHKP